MRQQARLRQRRLHSNMNRLECLASSSSGNCYYLELKKKSDIAVGKPTINLLLEAGIPYKEIVAKLANIGISMANVDAAIITHNHQDHCRAVEDLTARGLPVYGNSIITNGTLMRTMTAGSVKAGIAPGLYITPFAVEHDAPDSLGYIIQGPSGVKILFVNDCKFFKADLSAYKFDIVMIEANYDGQMIHYAYEKAKETHDYANIKRYERLLNSHMSIANCIKTLQMMDLSSCKKIFLMHLSDSHANELVFKARVKAATGVDTYAFKKCGGFI